MALDEKGNLIEHTDFTSGETEQPHEVEHETDFSAPVEAPSFGQRAEVEHDQGIEQVQPLTAPQEQDSAVEYEPKYTTENYGSKKKAEEALVLESLLNHGVEQDKAADEMEQILGLSADLKE
ncbi:MAG TPA: hypothetical protein VHQ41_01000 [Patescibacteria group bacterium]|jgi:hypothetical protein|nr:hypothetical protein [Patescibacteria group bacterium]